MAGKTAGKAPAGKAAAPESGGAATRWWQWVLIYPTLVVSVLTAAPQWFDKIQAVTNNVRDRNYREAEEQGALYAKNLTCTTAPFDWYLNPDNVNLDATICESGDIYVRATAPGQTPAFYFVPLQRVLRRTEPPAKQTAEAAPRAILTSGVAAESAANLRLVEGAFTLAQATVRPNIRAQQQMVVTTEVVCTKFLDKRMVLRHLRTPQACFDEVVDSWNGTTQKRTQVACRRTC